MRLVPKILLAVLVLFGIYVLFTSQNAQDTPDTKRQPTPSDDTKFTHGDHLEQPLFRTEQIQRISWRWKNQEATLQKKGEKWKCNGSSIIPDAFYVQKLLALVAGAPGPQIIKGSSEEEKFPGHFQIMDTQNGLEWEADFNKDTILWRSGSQNGRAVKLDPTSDLALTLQDGFLAFENHHIMLCQPSKVTGISVLAQVPWGLTKRSNAWVLQDNENPEAPADKKKVGDLFGQLCHLEVTHFLSEENKRSEPPSKPDLTIASGRDQAVEVYRLKEGRFKTGDAYFIKASKVFVALSPWMSSFLTNTDAFLQDTSIPLLAKITDPLTPQDERIRAIREIKEHRMQEAIPILKKLIFEKTEIDIYRYEAADALAEINTKESLKILADRLSEVGRSGFQLRLARALGRALGRPFTSDETTPDSERQKEVRDLLHFYKAQYEKNGPP